MFRSTFQFCRRASVSRTQSGTAALTSILFVIVAGITGLGTAVRAAAVPPGDRIVGQWLVESRDAIVDVSAHGEGDARRYEGRIAWLKDDRYHAEDGPDLDGKPVMDRHNPDPAKRQLPLLGSRMLWDLRFDGNRWTGGRVYNSDNGHSYNCNLRLIDDDHLRLHGYVGISMFGGNTTWTRVQETPANPPGTPSGANSGN
jgi:uncharacterized protein (DUF2147 family)